MPRISDLPAMTAPADDDAIAIVDDSTSSTKKITLVALKEWLQSLVGWISTAMIADDAVTPDKLSPLHVSSQLATTQTISSATFADTNLTMTLPTVGTWIITVNTRHTMTAASTWGEMRLWNTTDNVNADVDSASGETDWITGLIAAASYQLVTSKTIICETTEVDTVITLQARRGTGTNITLQSDTNGGSSMSAFRIG